MSTNLKSHQKKAVQRFSISESGLILFHLLGSGKTLTALTIINQCISQKPKLKVILIIPASLKTHYVEEQNKHDIKLSNENVIILTYGELINRLTTLPNNVDLLVVDEIHRARNPKTKTYQSLRILAEKSKKKLLLTGTLLYNSVYDLAPIINIFLARNYLPVGKHAFDVMFYSSQNLWDKIFGIDNEKKLSSKGKRTIEYLAKNCIDYYDGSDSDLYPTLTTNIVKVELSKEQIKYYKAIESGLPLQIRIKIWKNLPLNKKELTILNSFSIGLRQICNSLRPFVQSSISNNTINETKIDKIIKNLNLNIQSVVYSNFLDAGIFPLAEKLTSKKIFYQIVTGKTSKKDLAALVSAFNRREFPVLLLSSCAGEGLDFKNVEAVHIMEPHFNISKIKQVVGRARRLFSHIDLPQKRKRVIVYNYISVFPKSTFNLLGFKAKQTIDEYLVKYSQTKEAQLEQIVSLITTTKKDN